MQNIKDTELLDAFWQKNQQILKSYQTARDAKDSIGVEQARADHHAWEDDLKQQGQMFVRLYHWYEEAREVGNPCLDLHDVIWEKDVPELIENLRRYGIEKFTFSSSWSGAVETAWLFVQNGCKLEGLVELNSQYKDFLSNEYEKLHGYLFSVQ